MKVRQVLFLLSILLYLSLVTLAFAECPRYLAETSKGSIRVHERKAFWCGGEINSETNCPANMRSKLGKKIKIDACFSTNKEVKTFVESKFGAMIGNNVGEPSTPIENNDSKLVYAKCTNRLHRPSYTEPTVCCPYTHPYYNHGTGYCYKKNPYATCVYNPSHLSGPCVSDWAPVADNNFKSKTHNKYKWGWWNTCNGLTAFVRYCYYYQPYNTLRRYCDRAYLAPNGYDPYGSGDWTIVPKGMAGPGLIWEDMMYHSGGYSQCYKYVK